MMKRSRPERHPARSIFSAFSVLRRLRQLQDDGSASDEIPLAGVSQRAKAFYNNLNPAHSSPLRLAGMPVRCGSGPTSDILILTSLLGKDQSAPVTAKSANRL
jgi:hypothetical protein